MSIHVEIPEPLATQVAAAAKSHATSLEHYVIDAVAKTVAQDAASQSGHDDEDPVLGFFADDADLMDSIVKQAMIRRRTAPARTPSD